MKKLIFTIIVIFSTTIIFAQNEVDAFRYSQMYFEGTGRSMAMGNAFGAIGADVSTANTNPAGMGLFKHSEFVFAPSINYNLTESDFNGNKIYNDKLPFEISNMSFVLSINSGNDMLKYVNLSTGYNRSNNYTNSTQIQGINDKGSMLDYFMTNANGNSPENLNGFNSFLAWDTWLIDTVSGTNNLYTNPLWGAAYPGTPLYGETQTRIQTTKGGAGEWYFNGGFNIKDFFFFGATVAFPSFNYSYNLSHQENNFKDSTDLNNFIYNEYLEDNGSGINFKVGFILKPLNFIRIGGSFISPTYFTITDKFSTSIESHWDTPDSQNHYDYSSLSAENKFIYNLSTPMKLNGSLGIVIARFALIGVDYEYIDYSTMRLTSDDYIFSDENENIRQQFQSVSNIKAGAELNFGVFRLRGGYAMFQNPYKDNVFDMSQISAGFGFNSENFYCDFAYVLTQTKTNYYLYNGYIDEPVPSILNKNSRINMTMGFKF